MWSHQTAAGICWYNFIPPKNIQRHKHHITCSDQIFLFSVSPALFFWEEMWHITGKVVHVVVYWKVFHSFAVCGGSFTKIQGKGLLNGFRIPNKTLVECKSKCVYDLRCSSFDYYDTRKICRIHRRAVAPRMQLTLNASDNYVIHRCPVCFGNIKYLFWTGLRLGQWYYTTWISS